MGKNEEVIGHGLISNPAKSFTGRGTEEILET
jgi:hypothetical protein